jgi:two-component system, LytTR family, sensor histidine kinase AlgZ
VIFDYKKVSSQETLIQLKSTGVSIVRNTASTRQQMVFGAFFRSLSMLTVVRLQSLHSGRKSVNCVKRNPTNMLTGNEFIFLPKYRIIRHVLFWFLWHLGWTCVLSLITSAFVDSYIRIGVWIPAFIIYSYPVAYIAIPKLLLKGKYFPFLASLIFWLAVGWYLSVYYLKYISSPVLDLMDLPHGDGYAWQCLLCIITAAACFSALSLGKQWLLKQREFLRAEQEKMIAQLQVLKAQLHPHFLFNTLNNIYSFALGNSDKTPHLILKLSSLLSYMLYECKTDEVLLEKELEVMNNYIDLEKERYGDKLEISLNIEGDIQDKYITPLLILPFLENAFKHGTSEQLERPWMSVDVGVKDHLLQCKIVNSKNEFVPFHENGVGINNVKKRLEFLYPGKYELKLADEGAFFVVSLSLQLKRNIARATAPTFIKQQFEKFTHEIAVSPNR